jgi:hypothetical protein
LQRKLRSVRARRQSHSTGEADPSHRQRVELLPSSDPSRFRAFLLPSIERQSSGVVERQRWQVPNPLGRMWRSASSGGRLVVVPYLVLALRHLRSLSLLLKSLSRRGSIPVAQAGGLAGGVRYCSMLWSYPFGPVNK